jgi:hypothetical protein
MHTISWIGGLTFGVVFLALSTSNFVVVASYLRHRRHVSAIPLLGGLAGIGACFLLPIPCVRSFWWVPLIIDYGSLPMFIYFFASRIAASIRGDHAS